MGVRGLTSRISRRFVLILALAQLLLIYAWIIEPNWIEVTSHEAWFKNLPEEFNGLVVVHLSDLHMRKYGARERRVVARLAESTPGVIVITGDLTLEGSDPATIRQFLTALRDLKLPAGREPFGSGWFDGQYARMYVTRGIGTGTLPVRLFCRPELALITLKRSGPKR